MSAETPSQSDLYRDHLETLDRGLAEALERCGRAGLGLDGVVFHAGRAATYHADDREVAFWPAAHFRRWVPPLDGPEHTVVARPGERPKVVRVRPRDFWYDTSKPPTSYWEAHVELEEVESFDQVGDLVGDTSGLAYVGPSPTAAAELGIEGGRIEPEALLAPLDWQRAYKTPYEVALLERAAERAAEGHQGAREVFEAGGSEREIHWAFLESSDQLESEVPYDTIVALESKGAILHYQNKRGLEAAPGRVLLIDAGAGWRGYASDITRTWALPEVDDVFRQLVREMDAIERRLVAMVTPGRPYLEIHLEAHREVAALLVASGLLKVGAEEALERGLTRPFFPHGVGHHLGLQVHDVGGHQAGPEGGKVPPPDDHPLLRNTRVLEPGHAVTIEPGLYFIPMLLEPLREGKDAGAVDWTLVDRLAPLGGVRIEDDVVCTDDGPRDLTRSLIEGPRGE